MIAKRVILVTCYVDFCILWYDLFRMVDTKKSINVKAKPMLITGGVIGGLLLLFFLANSVIPNALVTLTRASSSGEVVVNGSYLLGEKILAKADGKDANKINVFLLDKNGKPVQGKSVDLTGMTTGVKQVNDLSDATGKVSFNLTSTTEGQYKINANYNGQELPQTIVVTFRN